MSVFEIQENVIKPLSLEEKKELHRFLTQELKRAEIAGRFAGIEEMYVSPGFEISSETGEDLQAVIAKAKA